MEHLLVTHGHEDHWLPHELYYRRPGFSEVPSDSVLRVHGNERVLALAREQLPRDLALYRVELQPIRLWEPIDLGDGASAVAVRAAHSPDELCVNYVLFAGGATILQGNDTGWYPDDTWEYLSGLKLDVVVLDCTYGKQESTQGHLGCSAVVRAKEHLAKLGALAEGCRFIANHFSHNGGWLQAELEAYLTPRGVEVGYDGMTVEVGK